MTTMEQQNNPDVKEADLLRSQALIHLINANVTVCAWPRAGGKTSGGIGPRILRLSEVMPRSQVLLMTDTYERIEDVLWPGIESFLQSELGMVPELDYVVHKKPPAHWVKPLFIPSDYDHTVTFSSGFTLCEVSMRKTGSANGFNAQAAIGDEWKYIDPLKFKSEVRPAIRGGKKYFGHLPEFQSMWFFSDKFPSKGADLRWMLDQRKEVNQESVDIIYSLQLEVFKLQQEIEAIDADKTLSNYKKEKEIKERERKIALYEETMNEKRMDLVYFSDALPYENFENLGDKYFRDLKRDLTKYEYEVAIENKDPDRAINPYYPDLGAQHFYKDLKDYNPNKPLIIALDYQFRITPVVTAQFDRLPDSVYTTLNFILSLHTLHPEGMEAALKLWADEFAGHPLKVVYYMYDQTAIGRTPYGKTFKDLVVNYLILRGWSVVEVYVGDTPDHDIKYEMLKKWFNCPADRSIRINELQNRFLKIALEKTDAILVNGKTKKDKSTEKSTKVPPEESTHYPDAFDTIVYGANELQLVPINDDPGMDFRLGK